MPAIGDAFTADLAAPAGAVFILLGLFTGILPVDLTATLATVLVGFALAIGFLTVGVEFFFAAGAFFFAIIAFFAALDFDMALYFNLSANIGNKISS
jgi:hypothetical protein